jgi:micrococcal nuclease
MKAPYVFNCTIDRVIDGDTIDVIIDLGFHIRVKHRIRLQGLHAPELKTVRGKEARTVLAGEVGCEPVWRLETEQDPSTFGRYVGRLADPDGLDLATMLLSERPDLFSPVKGTDYGRVLQ